MKIDAELSIKNIKKEIAKKGIYYTPKELAEYMLSFVKTPYNTAYDPTCGQGNLLAVLPDDVKKYGQEIHDFELEKAQSRLTNFTGYCGDTLKDPYFINEKFDLILANPPFSINWEREHSVIFDDVNVLPPKSKADYAFIMHCLHVLSDHGTAVIMGFPGILYRGNAEAKIRKWLVENNYIEKIVLIEGKKFTDTSIQTILLILKKDKTDTDITFIDSIINKERKVPIEEIEENDYNLSINSYVQEEKVIDMWNPEDNFKVSLLGLKNYLSRILLDAHISATVDEEIDVRKLIKIGIKALEELDKEACKDKSLSGVNLDELIKNITK